MAAALRFVLLSAWVVLSLAGCAIVALSKKDSPAQQLADTDPPPGFFRDRAIERALDDAQRRTGVGPTALNVLFAEAVIWHDSALGCPKPGAPIYEAMTPGFRIRIQSAEETLDYHATRRGRVVFCPSGQSLDQHR